MSQQHPKAGEWYARQHRTLDGGIQEWGVFVNHAGGATSMTAIACAIPETTPEGEIDQLEIDFTSQRSEEVAVSISALPDLIDAARDVTDLMVTDGDARDVTDPKMVHRLRMAVVKLQMALWKAGAGSEE